MLDPTNLDAAATLAAAEERVFARREVEVDELKLAAHWADLHAEPVGERDPMIDPGGEGTPKLREYAVPEYAIARGTHPATTRNLIADALDLRDRLPRVWKVTQELGCEPWVARKVASVSRAVPAAKIAVVDRAVAKAIAGHAPSTVLEIAHAKVIEADPKRHAMAREQARHERYVRLSRADEFGYRHIIAKVTAGDAAWIDAMVDRIADILRTDHGYDHNHDELRSAALGWLARPAELLKLLLEHTEAKSSLVEPVETTEDDRPVWAPSHLDETLGRLADLSCRQLKALRGTSGTVFVHVNAAALLAQHGIARVEGIGPMLIQALTELLGHADVKLQPVIDLNHQVRTDRYEHPDRMKDQIWLQTGGDAFPFANRSATRTEVDFDHVVPYLVNESESPPGQTGTHNAQPLRRTHHRWKTHGGYRARPAGLGRTIWQTPHGISALIDHRGTTRLTDRQATIMLNAKPGVDIYFANVSYQGT